MLYILGAALLVAAMVVLNLGRVSLDRLANRSHTTRSRVADFFSISFTGLFGTGFVLLLDQTIAHFDVLHLIGLAATVVGTVIGSRYANKMIARRTARTAA